MVLHKAPNVSADEAVLLHKTPAAPKITPVPKRRSTVMGADRYIKPGEPLGDAAKDIPTRRGRSRQCVDIDNAHDITIAPAKVDRDRTILQAQRTLDTELMCARNAYEECVAPACENTEDIKDLAHETFRKAVDEARAVREEATAVARSAQVKAKGTAAFAAFRRAQSQGSCCRCCLKRR